MTQEKKRPGFLESLADAAKKANEERAVGLEPATGDLTMPYRQEIGGSIFRWTWILSIPWKVQAIHCVSDNNIYDLRVGEYLVIIEPSTEPGHSFQLKPDAAKELADAILSAYEWQKIWRENVGAFLEQDYINKAKAGLEPEPIIGGSVDEPERDYDAPRKIKDIPQA